MTRKPVEKRNLKLEDLPTNPDVYYRDKGWKGWDDMLGTNKDNMIKFRVIAKTGKTVDWEKEVKIPNEPNTVIDDLLPVLYEEVDKIIIAGYYPPSHSIELYLDDWNIACRHWYKGVDQAVWMHNPIVGVNTEAPGNALWKYAFAKDAHRLIGPIPTKNDCGHYCDWYRIIDNG